jgi:hypothetical protein
MGYSCENSLTQSRKDRLAHLAAWREIFIRGGAPTHEVSCENNPQITQISQIGLEKSV